MLLGLSLSTAGYSNVADSVSAKRFGDAEGKVDALNKLKSGYESDFTTAKTKNVGLKESGNKLVTSLDSREYWLEVYRAINECLPRDVADQLDVEDITLKNRMNIKSVTAKKYENVAKWFDDIKTKQPVLNTMIETDRTNGPKGPGYVFTLVGEHYRHDEKEEMLQTSGFVKSTLLKNLDSFEVQQPGTPQPVPVRKLGISHAAMLSKQPQQIEYYPKGNKKTKAAGTKTTGGFGSFRSPTTAPVPTSTPDGQPKDGEASEKRIIFLNDFTVYFVWIPTPADKRLKEDPLKPAEPVASAAASNPTNAAATAPPASGAAPNAAATAPPK